MAVVHRTMTIYELIEEVKREQHGLRLGHMGPHDFYDFETGKQWPTADEEVIRLLEQTIEEVKELASHQCRFDSEDWCMVCGLDGRA